LEVAERVSAFEALSQDRGCGVWVGGVEDEGSGAVPGDPPSVVVEVHVVEAAEQDAAVDVGCAAFGVGVDVVGFAVCGGFVAAGPSAAAVALGEGEALFRGE
jgi:hypothetical protein